jgi:hypothetical protein
MSPTKKTEAQKLLLQSAKSSQKASIIIAKKPPLTLDIEAGSPIPRTQKSSRKNLQLSNKVSSTHVHPTVEETLHARLFHKKIIDKDDEFEISHLKKLPLTVRGSATGEHFTFELNATDEEDNHHPPTPDLTQ